MRSSHCARIAIALLASGLGLASGCNDNDLGLQKRHPNRPPETVLASGPPDSTYQTNYRVHLYWSGADGDGTIDHYDFILVDHPAVDDSIATTSGGGGNRVVVSVPEPDDPRWQSTSARDTLVITRADTLRRNPAPPPGTGSSEISRFNEFVRRQSFERWHTFFVRAVDNEGAADPTPDYRSFNSNNIAPVVTLQPPVDVQRDEFTGPPTIIFNWDGIDPVGDGTELLPIASRWVLVPSNKDVVGHYRGLPDTLYQLPASAWSPWRAWNASDGSGKRAVVRDLRPAGVERGVGFYLFAVQAMDEAGAVTPVFDWRTIGKNNTTALTVAGDVGPTLTLREPFLGTFHFSGASRPLPLDIAAGETVRFCWAADASSYGGEIVAYRYGWDIRDPDVEEEWEQNWSSTATCAPVRVFNSGVHIFFLETRDNAESITRARIEMTVRQVTRRRDLLLVDDSVHPQGDSDPAEAREDTRWLTVIDSLEARQPFVFDPVRDVYDVRQNRRQAPPLAMVFDYKTVVWSVVPSSQGSALRSVAQFIDPFLEGQNTVRGFNYLNLYLDNGGELWISGQMPSFELFPLTENRSQYEILPANITNWNLDQHPDEDSVGVASLLYRMGVEAVDMGSGGLVRRPRSDRLDQGCIGFRRPEPTDGDAARFTTTAVLEHTHTLVLTGREVESPPDSGLTLTTGLAAEHTHTLHLTARQARTLASGGQITVTTASSALPSPHAHEVTLHDLYGRWGAPSVLTPDSSWPLPPLTFNPYKSRVSVEIYNMPSFLAQQTPNLSPPAARVLPLYLFTGPTPADPATGVLYPFTADEQPALLLARAATVSPAYSRAYCGFEPWRLTLASHIALAEFILLHHMRLGLPESR
jgi:hypothetical protein